MNIEIFLPFHVELLRAQGVQPEQLLELGPANYAGFARPLGPCFTARHGDSILLCGGIAQTAPHMGLCWALLSERAKPHLLALHRATRRFLDLYTYRRIETNVRSDFSSGCRWVEMLGFVYEGVMPGYGERGEAHIRYGRVTPWHS